MGKIMSKYTKSAEGKECQIRLSGVCNGDNDTVVLCHLNGGGMGAKRADIHGAYGCSRCHDEVDRRTRILEADFVCQCHLEAIIRTQDIMISEGILTL